MIKHQIKGNASQMIVCQLDPGQTVYCEAGKFLWKTVNVGVETRFTTHEQEEATKDRTAEKDAFVAAENSVKFDVKWAGFSAGRKGGEGFILERFTGIGTLFIAGAGNFIDLNPSKYGGKIQVDTGCVVAFEDGITYGVERIGKFDAKGMKTAFFGGEGMSLATLEGDGEVILQSVNMVALARTLVHASGQASTEGTAGSIRGLLGGSTD